MVVPPDARDIVGKAVFKEATGHTDEHLAVAVAAPIIAEFQRRIATARQAGKRLEQVTADQLAERYRAERSIDPERAEITRVTDIINFVLTAHGIGWLDHARRVSAAGNDIHEAIRQMPDGEAAVRTADLLTGHATPFLTHIEKWKPHAVLKPRPLDQAISVNSLAITTP